MSSEVQSVLPDRSYALRGLSPRDTLVFKSMVRLLSGKTKDRWICVEDDQADLLIVGQHAEQTSSDRRADALRPWTQVLRVDAAGRGSRVEGLVLPLRADEVCQQLDRAGERLSLLPGDAVPVMFRLQLVRWPGALLLKSDPQYLKLATLLGTRPTTVDELVQKSGCPRWLCDSFAGAMHGHGMARWILEPIVLPDEARSVAADLPPPRADMPSGLLARIRLRLNL